MTVKLCATLLVFFFFNVRQILFAMQQHADKVPSLLCVTRPQEIVEVVCELSSNEVFQVTRRRKINLFDQENDLLNKNLIDLRVNSSWTFYVAYK